MTYENSETLALGGWRYRNCLFLFLLTLLACDSVPAGLHWPLHETSPRDRYIEALHRAQLAKTQVFRAWEAAGKTVLLQKVEPTLPHREKLFFSDQKPHAGGFRLSLEEGQKLEIALDTEPKAVQVFLDLFRITGPVRSDTVRLNSWVDIVDYAKWSGDTLSYEVTETGQYLVRLQPELLAECESTIDITVSPTYAFPVEGKDNQAIWSFFGDPRDGGRRKHKGIDIFAKRGTPIVAISPGWVSRVREGGLGGKSVWIRDEARGIHQYYAHLHEQLVEAGTYVNVGDTIGTVGNTGNARTTPSHLHFGLYRRGRGAVDPLPFVFLRDDHRPRIRTDEAWLGQVASIRTSTATLKNGPGRRQKKLRTLARHQVLQIEGLCSDHVRVSLPDGETGYLAASQVRPIEGPLRTVTLEEESTMWSRPDAARIPRDRVTAGARISVLGLSSGMAFVRGPSGLHGWMKL